MPVLSRMRISIFGWEIRAAPSWVVSEPAKDLMPKATPKEARSKNGFFKLAFDQFPLECVEVRDDVGVRVVNRLQRQVLLLSSGDAIPGSRKSTGGFCVRLPDTFDPAVSGFRVRVKISAKAARGVADAEFTMAYFTSGGETSGWQKMSVGYQFETLTFEWDVPAKASGHGDYIGIMPADVGAIEVAGLAVVAIART